MTDSTDALVGTVGTLLVLGAAANMVGHMTGIEDEHHRHVRRRRMKCKKVAGSNKYSCHKVEW